MFRAPVRAHALLEGQEGQNRGCPCKGEGIHCGAECTCGSTAKPCKNKVRLLCDV